MVAVLFYGGSLLIHGGITLGELITMVPVLNVLAPTDAVSVNRASEVTATMPMPTSTLMPKKRCHNAVAWLRTT